LVLGAQRTRWTNRPSDNLRIRVTPRHRTTDRLPHVTHPLPSYELVGPADAPIVVVLGGISAHRHATATTIDPAPGWWNDVVGRNRAIDTTRLRVLSFDYVDGGSMPDHRPERVVTSRDQADVLALLLDALDIPVVQALIGSSYGGMVALAFAEHYGARVEHLIVISAAHEPHPMSTALRSIQRQIVTLGLDTGRTSQALALARALGMTTYRSAREFAKRFDVTAHSIVDGRASFPVEDYLRTQGDRFAAQWRPERFLALSLSCDLHHVDPRRIQRPTLLVAAQDDTVIPREQLEELSALLDAPTQLVDVPTLYGHDAFLTEPEKIGAILACALATSVLA
jgi:homoserine O-acetyltransferase/O-succinyltransferase